MSASDGFVQINPDSSGQKVDVSKLTVSGNTVDRQRIVISSDIDPYAFVPVANTDPNWETDYGLVVRNVFPARGETSNTVTGPMIQAVVNDTPENYVPGAIQPISLTTEGRIRVAVTEALTYLDFFGDDSDSEFCNAGPAHCRLSDHKWIMPNDPWGDAT